MVPTSQTAFFFCFWMTVTAWLVIVERNKLRSEKDCVLALGDNTSANSGWLRKSSKLRPGSLHCCCKLAQIIAWKMACLIIGSTHCLPSQHIKGEQNTVSNLLSFGCSHPLAPALPAVCVLTQPFHLHIPQLILGFNISPLAQQGLLLSHSGIILNLKQEESHETQDGVWR